jgi:HEAT repeat protein
VRQRAAAALDLIGPEARAATPALLKALKDKSPRVRAVAAHALGEVGGYPSLTVPALTLALNDGAPDVKKQATLALVSLGQSAVPSLREALKSPEPAVRRDTAEALGKMGADAKEAAGDLALLLKDDNPQVRATSAAALSGMGKEAQAAIPALLAAMRQEKRFEVQKYLFQALSLVGSRDLPGFLKAVREVDKQGQWAIAYHLGQFGPNPGDAVKPLIKLLSDPVPGKRMTAALALGKLGLLSEESVPALLKALDDPIPQVQIAVATSLSKLAPGHERLAEVRIVSAVKRLTEGLVLRPQQLAIAEQNRLAEALRPLNRRALVDPLVQSQFDDILNASLLTFLPGNRGRVPSELTRQLAEQAQSLPPEAVPALVRSINQAAAMNLGFC